MTVRNCASILPPSTLLGDSISVNGTCLTVTHLSNSDSTDPNQRSFRVGMAPETLRRTNLGSLQVGSGVNLERAVRADTRMGGHFVQGHVDTVATIVSVTPDGEALTFRLSPRKVDSGSVMRYIVEKGYVTLDGASLTVTKVHDATTDAAEGDEWFEVMLISYTQEKIVMTKKRKGDGVNVEVDQVGKYVEKSVIGYLQEGKKGAPALLEKLVGRIVDEKLKPMNR